MVGIDGMIDGIDGIIEEIDGIDAFGIDGIDGGRPSYMDHRGGQGNG